MWQLLSKLMSAVPALFGAMQGRSEAQLTVSALRRAVAASAGQVAAVEKKFAAQGFAIGGKGIHPAVERAQQDHKAKEEELAKASENAAKQLDELKKSATLAGVGAGAIAYGWRSLNAATDVTTRDLAHWDAGLAKSVGALDRDRMRRTAQLARDTSAWGQLNVKLQNEAEEAWRPIKEFSTNVGHAAESVWNAGKYVIGKTVGTGLGFLEAVGEGLGYMTQGGSFSEGYKAAREQRNRASGASQVMQWLNNLANSPIQIGAPEVTPRPPIAPANAGRRTPANLPDGESTVGSMVTSIMPAFGLGRGVTAIDGTITKSKSTEPRRPPLPAID